MANILLTSRCSRSCPYCFARKEMVGSKGETMSWSNFIYLADFLQASGEKNVSLLGGEPTLHPDFVDYMLYLIERGFKVNVFTNGVMSTERLGEIRDHLTDLPVDSFDFICNLNNPKQTPAAAQETKKIHDFLFVMGPWTQSGFNIYRPDFELEFIFDMINRYGLKRRLRLGVAHPVPGTNGVYLRPEDIKKVVDRLYSYRMFFDTFRVKPGLDCGFPSCGFSDIQLGWLQRLSGGHRFACGAAIDIAPDMSVYSCFPLSDYHRRSILEFDKLEQVIRYFADLHKNIRAEVSGIFPECDGCLHQREGMCSGGGVCHILNKLKGEAIIRFSEVESGLKKTHMPE